MEFHWKLIVFVFVQIDFSNVLHDQSPIFFRREAKLNYIN